MGKYLIITKHKDYIATCYKKVAKKLGLKCQVYNANGTLIHPASLYDGEDREWAIWFINTHKVGESSEDARLEYTRRNQK